MNPAIYLAIFLPLFVVIMTRQRENDSIIQIKARRKKLKETEKMTEFAKSFVGKECVIYMFNGNQHVALIKEVTQGAILIEKEDSNEIINLDFVTRIREYPKKKNGKKKSIVLD